MAARRAKRRGKKNGKRRKQPKVGRWACRGHTNKYAAHSKHRHNAYGVREDD